MDAGVAPCQMRVIMRNSLRVLASKAVCPSFAQSLLVGVPILTLLAPFVGGSSGSLVAPHADARFDIPLIVPALSRLLVLRVCLIAFPAACCVALRPSSEPDDATDMLC